MKIKLEKGLSSINIAIPNDKVLDTIIGKDVPGIGHDQIKEIISKGIKAHAPEGINHKKIAVIIPDDTRLWARGDIFVPQIVKSLLALGCSTDNIKIIIAVGTHADMEKDMFSRLAGTYCTQRVEILNSANKNQDRLVQIGETHKNTQLYITKEIGRAHV